MLLSWAFEQKQNLSAAINNDNPLFILNFADSQSRPVKMYT